MKDIMFVSYEQILNAYMARFSEETVAVIDFTCCDSRSSVLQLIEDLHKHGYHIPPPIAGGLHILKIDDPDVEHLLRSPDYEMVDIRIFHNGVPKDLKGGCDGVV
jgi:hypothetical protein